MSTTATITVMQDDKRGLSSGKQPRLPAIAPKDDQASSTSSSRSGNRISAPVHPRNRLPPRSRTGCWTCRTRKVKCDEGKPVCGQCGRLGHSCDYSPRLSFRDDTSRVVERMPDVFTAGSSVWDRQSSISARRRNTNGSLGGASPTPSSTESAVDDLPSFSQLVNDEDRHAKALNARPGTYTVIFRPESFANLPEYSEDPQVRVPDRRPSIATSLASSLGSEAIPIQGDPNTVWIPRFEDSSRRTIRDGLKSPVTSPVTASRPSFKREESESSPNIRTLERNTVQHFRDVVWKQIIPPEHGTDNSVTLLDEAATQFPPVSPPTLMTFWKTGN